MKLETGEKLCSQCHRWRAARYYTVGYVCEDCQVDNIVRWNGYSRNLNLMRTGDVTKETQKRWPK